MLALIIFVLATWVQDAETQECAPISIDFPQPVVPSSPLSAAVVLRQRMASEVLHGSWWDGPLFIPFRRFNFQQEEFTRPANRTIRRKEYRQMSWREMKLFRKAINYFHNTSQFNELIGEHERLQAPNAHFGASFAGWHRHYLYILEQTLRALDPQYKDVYIPYWDSSLDHGLPSPHDSALWSWHHWGTGDGVVSNGKLCRNWEVNPACRERGLIVLRQLMNDRNFLYSQDRISRLLAAETFTEMMIHQPHFPISQFESDHGLVHCYVGGCTNGPTGHLASLQCSPNDPVFFILHSFVDYLWYEWSRMPNKTNTYPVPGIDGATIQNIGGFGNLAFASMRPFPGLTNADGHRENFYSEYEERPSLIRCTSDSQCNSPTRMLFCHQCRCMGKVGRNGDCTGLPHNACYCRRKTYTPRCTENRCRCRRGRY